MAWDAEGTAARRLSSLAERVEEPQLAARLMVLSAFCRAHAARLLTRLTTLGNGPLPVPDETEEGPADLIDALLEEARAARRSASRYATMMELARAHQDLSSAWVCELNRSEEEERARELLSLAEERAPRLEGSEAAQAAP